MDPHIHAIYLQNKFHPMVIVMVSLMAIIPIIVQGGFLWWGPFVAADLLLFLYAGLQVKTLLKIALFVFFLSFTVLFLNLLYPAQELRSGETLELFWSFTVYKSVLEASLLNFFRIFVLSLISASSTLVMNLDKLILYYASSKGDEGSKGKVRATFLKGFIVYTKSMFKGWERIKSSYVLLAALNSIFLLREESERISMVMKFRGVPFYRRHLLLFPLLVFAIKHSQRAALALIARGLSSDKVFYFDYSLSAYDQKLLLFLQSFFILWSVLAILLS
ncbi:MAG: hypothetical protein HQK52_02655 [Oligoflexia bacterium]|nr:hypothetical protein [Oligoflexia bacterium]